MMQSFQNFAHEQARIYVANMIRECINNNDLANVKKLLSDPGFEWPATSSPVLHAIEAGRLEIAKWLVEEKVYDLYNLKKKFGPAADPFLLAIRNGHLEIIEWLYKKGCHCLTFNDIDKGDDDPASHAVEYDHFDVVKFLVKNIYINKPENGKGPFLTALEKRHVPVLEWLTQENTSYQLNLNHEDYEKHLYSVLLNIEIDLLLQIFPYLHKQYSNANKLPILYGLLALTLLKGMATLQQDMRMLQQDMTNLQQDMETRYQNMTTLQGLFKTLFINAAERNDTEYERIKNCLLYFNFNELFFDIIVNAKDKALHTESGEQERNLLNIAINELLCYFDSPDSDYKTEKYRMAAAFELVSLLLAGIKILAHEKDAQNPLNHDNLKQLEKMRSTESSVSIASAITAYYLLDNIQNDDHPDQEDIAPTEGLKFVIHCLLSFPCAENITPSFETWHPLARKYYQAYVIYNEYAGNPRDRQILINDIHREVTKTLEVTKALGEIRKALPEKRKYQQGALFQARVGTTSDSQLVLQATANQTEADGKEKQRPHKRQKK